MLLTLLHILQSLSVGGEFPGAISFVAEHTQKKRRGFMCSWIYFGINTGAVLGSALCALITSTLSAAALHSWGWRIPFLLGVVSAAISLYLRLHTKETSKFRKRGCCKPNLGER